MYQKSHGAIVRQNLLLVILLAVFLTACNKTATVPVTAQPDSGADASQAAIPIKIWHEVHTETAKDIDGTSILEAKIILPEIENPNSLPGIAAINEYYDKQAEDFFAFVFSEGRERALAEKADALENGYDFRPHVYDRDVSVYYNGNNLLSVLAMQYENTGGAHPNAVWLADTFDVSSGKELSLSDILGGTKEQALEKVYQRVIDEINEKQGTDQNVWYEDYLHNVRQDYSEEDFVLSEDSLMVFYQLYTIAPYAAGLQEFEIPFRHKEEFARDIGVLPAQDQERDAYWQAARLIEQNEARIIEQNEEAPFEINWHNYRYRIENVTEQSALLIIEAIIQHPSHKKGHRFTLNMIRHEDSWQLDLKGIS